MATPTVKVVADVEPSLKQAFDRTAQRNKITRRQALENAMRAYVAAEGKGNK
jgi:hypothetical protein